MVFSIKIWSGCKNIISPITQPGTNIREVRTPSQKVFTQEHNELFVQQVVQYSQEIEGDELHYHVPSLNESSTEDDTKKAYRNMTCQFHPDKNNNSQASGIMLTIN